MADPKPRTKQEGLNALFANADRIAKNRVAETQAKKDSVSSSSKSISMGRDSVTAGRVGSNAANRVRAAAGSPVVERVRERSSRNEPGDRFSKESHDAYVRKGPLEPEFKKSDVEAYTRGTGSIDPASKETVSKLSSYMSNPHIRQTSKK